MVMGGDSCSKGREFESLPHGHGTWSGSDFCQKYKFLGTPEKFWRSILDDLSDSGLPKIAKNRLP